MSGTQFEIVGAAINKMLRADSNLVLLVGDRLYLFAAPANAPFPYITYQWAFGGAMNTDPNWTFDEGWLVSAVSDDMATANRIAARIALNLRNKPAQFPSGWKDWAGVTEIEPYWKHDDVQGLQVWRIGAFYRFLAGLQRDSDVLDDKDE